MQTFLTSWKQGVSSVLSNVSYWNLLKIVFKISGTFETFKFPGGVILLTLMASASRNSGSAISSVSCSALCSVRKAAWSRSKPSHKPFLLWFFSGCAQHSSRSDAYLTGVQLLWWAGSSLREEGEGSPQTYWVWKKTSIWSFSYGTSPPKKTTINQKAKLSHVTRREAKGS